jgi:GR25 family glycosyltransferase involved in LPS biosynthesis
VSSPRSRRLTLRDLVRYVRHEYRNVLVVVPYVRLQVRQLMTAAGWRKAQHFPGAVPDPIVINLPFRQERLRAMHEELGRIGLPNYSLEGAVHGVTVFPEPPHLAGKRGCAASHINVLRRALHSKEAVFVLEDDVEFTGEADLLRVAVQHFLGNPTMDVLCLHSWSSRTRPINEIVSVATDVTSTAAYILKPRAIRFVLRDFERSARALARGRNLPIDHSWWKSQRWDLVFVVPNFSVAAQVGEQSDTAVS